MRFTALVGSKGIASRAGLLRLALLLSVVGATFGIWRSTQATGTTTLALSPAGKVQLYYNRTPFTETLNLTNASNVAAYQFRLTWNPTKLQWVSSDLNTLGPAWLASTGRGPLCSQIYDATATSTPTNTATFTATVTGTRTSTPTITPSPTGTPPTYTPTPTWTPTETFTVTNTPNAPTPTRTATPTPAGNITYGCASLGTPGQIGVPAGPSVGDIPVPLANFTFKSIATAEASDVLNLTDVGVANALSTPAVVVSSNASVVLAGCHDMDGDGVISILDLVAVAAHYGATVAVPLPPGWVWVPLYDVDGDGRISILDLVRIAAGYGQKCAV